MSIFKQDNLVYMLQAKKNMVKCLWFRANMMFTTAIRIATSTSISNNYAVSIQIYSRFMDP